MSEKELISREKVEHSGIFEFQAFYAYAHGWLKDEGYGVTEGNYSEKVVSNARNISIKWEAVKNISDYFKIKIDVEISVNDLLDVEVDIDGKKKKANKGNISVDIKGTLIRDPESKWESNPLQRVLRGIYDKYVIPQKTENMRERVGGDVRELKEQLKSFLALTGKR